MYEVKYNNENETSVSAIKIDNCFEIQRLILKEIKKYFPYHQEEEGLILYFTEYLYFTLDSKEKQSFLFVIHNKNPSEYLLHNINR